MFEERIPFYAIGDIVYEADLDFLKILEIDNNGTGGVRIPLGKVSSFQLKWMPVTEYGDDYSIELSSKGLVGQEPRTLGRVKHQSTQINEQFLITADFSSFDTEEKIIQVLEDGVLVEEFVGFLSSNIAVLNRIPVSCGKLAQAAVDPLDATVCYFMEFEERTVFDVQGVSLLGDEIRILSMTDLPIEHLSEASLLVAGMDELVIVDANSITTGTDEFEDGKYAFKVFPNPVKNGMDVVFDYEVGGKYNCLIYDNNGRLALEGEIASNSTYIDVRLLPRGTYYLRIKDNSNAMFLPVVYKIVKID